MTPPGWRDVLWESNLDHIFTNLDLLEFAVLDVEMSDHWPLHFVASQPKPAEATAEAKVAWGGCYRGGVLCAKMQGMTQKPCATILADRAHHHHSVSIPLVVEDMVMTPLMFEDLLRSPSF